MLQPRDTLLLKAEQIMSVARKDADFVIGVQFRLFQGYNSESQDLQLVTCNEQ